MGLAAALLFLTPMLPTLLILGGVLAAAQSAFSGEGGEGGGKEDSSQKIVDRLDKLEQAILGMEIRMDGQKVGEVISLSGTSNIIN